jgi:GT2 family glycosyltransferase
MVRRVRQTSSRGSKKRYPPVSRGEAIDVAKSASLSEAPASAHFDGEDVLATPEITSDAVFGRNNAEDGQSSDGSGSPSNGLIQTSESEQHLADSEFFPPMDPADGDFVVAENFDEDGYLRFNPDVRRAIDIGQVASGYAHYLLYGRSEGRTLPDTPREARNILLAAAHDAARTDVFPKEARCSIDALIIAPMGGVMIVGWIDDVSQPLSCVRLIGPDWRVVIDASRFVRVRRLDVENAIGGRRSHAFGFIGFLHFDRGGDGSGPMRVELWQSGGYSTAIQCVPTLVEDVELRDTILAHLAGATFFGIPCIESMSYLQRGVGAELVRFNQWITRRMVSAPYVERFGPQVRSPRGSIVVCLYGKPEFFFVQNCLYSGLPGIDEYEFIYVSNSPEMAETLLREAHCASLIYGLPISIVILPGNAGFGAANNVAARVARSNRLLVVNPDVFPRDRDWAKKHTELLSSVPAEQARIFGVPLYYDDGSLMHGGMYFEVDVGLSLSGGNPVPARICRTEHYGKGAPAKSVQFNRPRPVPAVTGAFISIERSWFEQLGGFTEAFIFGHYEDADLCLKSIAKGTAPWIHDIRLWHLEGKGSTRRPHHEGGSIVNRWLFSNTWMPMIENGLLGRTPTHPLMQSVGTRAPWGSDTDFGKPKIVRQRRVS